MLIRDLMLANLENNHLKEKIKSKMQNQAKYDLSEAMFDEISHGKILLLPILLTLINQLNNDFPDLVPHQINFKEFNAVKNPQI